MTEDINPVLHPPARLQMAALLSRVEEADFATIRDILDVSDSVLSKHLSALGEVGYVRMRKAPLDGRQRTWATLSREGRKAFRSHMAAHETLIARAQEAVAKDQGPR